MVSKEQNVCEICGSSDVRLLFAAKDRNRQIDDKTFQVFQCRDCGVGFTVPKLPSTELSRYYTQEYYSLNSSEALEAALWPHNQARVDHIRKFVSGGSLLDVGAGTGMFLKTAKENGFDVQGLEMSSDAASFGGKVWGIPIRQGNLHETSLDGSSYDVVTLGHVFEHLPEPVAALRQLHTLLKPEGMLVLTVPNFDSFQALLFRSRWFHLDVPRHLFHYPARTLQFLMERNGFAITDVNFYSSEHNWAGILGSVMRLSRPGESALHKAARKLIGMPVARFLAYCESSAGHGGTVEVYARKL